MTMIIAAGLAAFLTASAEYQQPRTGRGAEPPPPAAQGSAPVDISGFSVVLVVGETQATGGGGTAQELPAGAQRALNDMREFLPYKHYRVLDSQWTSCCSPRSRATVSGRLQGLSVSAGPAAPGAVNLVPRSYAFSITAGTSSPTISMQFVLTIDDPGRHVSAERVRELAREREDLRAEIELAANQITGLQRRVEVGAVSGTELPPLVARHASLQRRLADLEKTQQELSTGGQQPIVDSSFTMAAGETVVVGTSRLGGDKALIALVTAVRKR